MLKGRNLNDVITYEPFRKKSTIHSIPIQEDQQS